MEARLLEARATYGYSSITKTILSSLARTNTNSKAVWKESKEVLAGFFVTYSKIHLLKFSKFCFSFVSTPVKKMEGFSFVNSLMMAVFPTRLRPYITAKSIYKI